MSDIVYSYGNIEQAVADMDSGVTNLKNRLEDMDSQLRQLQSSWDGRAKEAYETSKAKWTDGMNGIVDILTNVSKAVMEARQSAEATDSRNAASFS